MVRRRNLGRFSQASSPKGEHSAFGAFYVLRHTQAHPFRRERKELSKAGQPTLTPGAGGEVAAQGSDGTPHVGSQADLRLSKAKDA